MPLRPSSAPVGDLNLLSSIPRWAVSAEAAVASGVLRLVYVRAPISRTYTAIRAWTGSVPAAATPTLNRFGVYSVAGNGDLALIASTANDVTAFATAATAYQRTLSAPVDLVQGNQYAFACLTISASTMPALKAASVWTSAEAILADRLTGSVSGQSDLPSSVPVGSIGGTAVIPYVALIP